MYKNTKMKKSVYVLMCVSLMLLAGCSSQKKNEKDLLQAQMQDSVAKSGAPSRMQVSDVKTTFSYRGKEYKSSVMRRPDETLPIVNNGQGENFVDNSIALRLICGNKVVVDKVFTKQSFASLVDAQFMQYAVLEGLVYDQTTPQGILYAASVGYPQSDLYVPIRLTITADGQISMSKEELMDDYPETEEEKPLKK